MKNLSDKQLKDLFNDLLGQLVGLVLSCEDFDDQFFFNEEEYEKLKKIKAHGWDPKYELLAREYYYDIENGGGEWDLNYVCDWYDKLLKVFKTL